MDSPPPPNHVFDFPADDPSSSDDFDERGYTRGNLCENIRLGRGLEDAEINNTLLCMGLIRMQRNLCEMMDWAHGFYKGILRIGGVGDRLSEAIDVLAVYEESQPPRLQGPPTSWTRHHLLTMCSTSLLTTRLAQTTLTKEFEEDPQEEPEEDPEETQEEEEEEPKEESEEAHHMDFDFGLWDEEEDEAELIFPYEAEGSPYPPPPASLDNHASQDDEAKGRQENGEKRVAKAIAEYEKTRANRNNAGGSG
nr:hypothetical protein [Tanacetum cinerariifolium]